MDISDFKIVRALGNGSYSDVFLAELLPEEAFPGLVPAEDRHTSPELFALKVVDKHLAVKYDVVDQIFLERRLHEALNNETCVARLSFTFKDDANLYFGLEPCMHGELYDAIEVGLERSEIEYYAAEIVVMLEVLRQHEVVHRDLKPENILLGTNGHLKLVDFGSALWFADTDEVAKRKIERKKGMLVGTAEYLAPEALEHKDGTAAGYGLDLWSFGGYLKHDVQPSRNDPLTRSLARSLTGVILYQMLVGNTPFRGGSEYLTFQNVLKNEPDLEKASIYREAKDLIRNLLRSEPNERLGVASVDDLRAHPFFRDVDWDTVYDEARPTAFYLRQQASLDDRRGGSNDTDAPESSSQSSDGADWELQGLQSIARAMKRL